jgi:hypothetical protein
MPRPARPVRLILLLLLGCGGGDGLGGPNGEVNRIILVADDSTLAITDTVRLNAAAFDRNGDRLDPSDGSTTLSKLDLRLEPAGVVTVSAGLVTAVAEGSTRLIASLDRLQDTITFVVDGTVHLNTVTADEIWTRAAGPHFVRTSVRVGGPTPVTLTIEPGTELRFAEGAGLVMDREGSALRAIGTAEAPITFDVDSSRSNEGYWAGVLLATSASELRHVVMRSCAGSGALVQTVDLNEGCIVIAGLFPTPPRPVLQDVTILDAGYFGIVAQLGGGFGAGSGGLVIRHVGRVPSGASPILIGANEASTVPTGSKFSQNRDNYVLLWQDDALRVTTTQTWSDPGVPYAVRRPLSVEGPSAPVLTLSPGTAISFGDGTGLLVGVGAAGGIKALGTADAPVRFTGPLFPQPSAGTWGSVVLGSSLAAGSTLDHAVFEYGGRGGIGWRPAEVVVMVNHRDDLLTNSTITESASCGLLRVWPVEPTATDYTLASLGNTFSANNTGDQCGP